jgi:hypothetical protein
MSGAVSTIADSLSLGTNVSASGPGAITVKVDRSKLYSAGIATRHVFYWRHRRRIGFQKDVGFVSTVPLSVILVVLAVVPLVDDLVAHRH